MRRREQGSRLVTQEPSEGPSPPSDCQQYLTGNSHEVQRLLFDEHLGVPGGNSAQRLVPASSAFQADVARGSMCRPLPLRAGPITNHLMAGTARGHISGGLTRYLLLRTVSRLPSLGDQTTVEDVEDALQGIRWKQQFRHRSLLHAARVSHL